LETARPEADELLTLRPIPRVLAPLDEEVEPARSRDEEGDDGKVPVVPVSKPGERI
jgi:hypothetical protein